MYSVLIYYLYFALYLLFCRFALALINHFRNIKNDCYKASKHLRELYDTQYNILSKTPFNKVADKSFDYAILEKSKNINGIKINIPYFIVTLL